MKRTNDTMSNFNISKMIKAILRVGAAVVQIAVSLFFVIALFSAVTVVMNFSTSIGTEKAILNYADTTNVSVAIPFNFNNTGFYDIDDLTFTVDLNIHNITDDFDVLNGSRQFTIEAGEVLNTTLIFDSGWLEPNLIAGLFSNSTGYNMTLYASISGNYVYNLIPFGLNVTADMPLDLGL